MTTIWAVAVRYDEENLLDLLLTAVSVWTSDCRQSVHKKRVGKKSQHRALSLSLWIMWKDVSKLLFKSLNLRSSFFCCCSTGLRIRLFNFSLKILTCALYILRVSLEDLKEKNGSPWWEWDSTSPYSITVPIPLVHSNSFLLKIKNGG